MKGDVKRKEEERERDRQRGGEADVYSLYVLLSVTCLPRKPRRVSVYLFFPLRRRGVGCRKRVEGRIDGGEWHGLMVVL